MIRAFWFFAKVTIAIAIVLWLANRPGQVAIEWGGYIVETSVGLLLLAVLVLVAVGAVVYRLYKQVRRAPGLIGRARAESRRDQGYRALTQGMVAVAAGDGNTAAKLARKAESQLREPPLTLLLSAQAAQLNGDEAAARRFFEAMLDRHETSFLGLRGLLTQALLDNDPTRALELAQKAREISPESPWVQRTCFTLEVKLRRWSEAQISLSGAVKNRAIESDVGRRQKTAILIERSREAEGEDRNDEALSLAHQAVNLRPDFAPAVAREARLLARVGRLRQAARLIEKTWSQSPHAELAEAYRTFGPDNEQPLDRVKRVERLHALVPEHAESLIVLGEAELEADLWAAARNHLTAAEALEPSRRVYRLLAELETREADDAAAARNWLAKADTAPPDTAWVCRSCGATHAIWSAVCGNCFAFDTMVWTIPTVAVHLPAADEATAPPRIAAAAAAI